MIHDLSFERIRFSYGVNTLTPVREFSRKPWFQTDPYRISYGPASDTEGYVTVIPTDGFFELPASDGVEVDYARTTGITTTVLFQN